MQLVRHLLMASSTMIGLKQAKLLLQVSLLDPFNGLFHNDRIETRQLRSEIVPDWFF